jgi:polysaccharide biosynthesis transport protein
MSIARLFQVLLARWKTFSLVFIIAACMGVSTAYYQPKYYSSTATVVVDGKIDPVAGLNQLATPSYLATQVEIIKSSRVGSKVTKTLKLDQNAQLRQQFSDTKGVGDFNEWLANLIQKALVAEAGRGSSIIKITYTSADPNFSALMANAFVRAYLDVVLEMRVEPARRYADFFDDRSKALRDAVEKAQSRLSAYQKEKGIIGADEGSDVERAKLNDLSAQLLQAQNQAIEAGSRQTQAQQAADRTQEVMASGLINTFKGDLARQETRLQELSSKYGDAHPQVVEIKVTISELKSRIESETKRVTGSVSVSNNITKQRESELRSATEAQRAKVLKLKEVRDDLTVLQRDLDIAQKSYDNVQTRFNQSSLESQNQQTNVSVLGQAEVSNESKSQIFIKTAGKALIGALGAAAIAAFALEFFDKRVRVASDIQAIADLPIIGVMPKPDGSGIFGRSKPSQLQRRLLRQLPRPS